SIADNVLASAARADCRSPLSSELTQLFLQRGDLALWDVRRCVLSDAQLSAC
ncbi:MAG: hypothetical protein ACI8XO_003990, partial [Verrucomicrobiales bacterium]